MVVAVGLFGTMAHEAAARTRELAVRRALGASPAHVVALLTRRNVFVATAGVALGVAALYMGRKSISSVLFVPGVTDPVVLSVVAAVLILIATLAGAGPAVRVNRRSPADALRAE